jgi:methylmalonyl-CoA/ethylmalonyl-CoA epimerase
MIRKIEHLGIAVNDMEKANRLFSMLLNKEPYKSEAVESEQVNTSFFMLGETKVELLSATGEASAIAKYIAKKGEGIHHIAMDVDDIDFEINRLRAAGFEVINAAPKDGADNKRICFLHPKSTGGVLIELCEEKKQL